MADYLSQHTGEQLDTAVQKALDITSTPANIDAAVAQELATADYVVESGTSGNWYYKKFASGTAVIDGMISGELAYYKQRFEEDGIAGLIG